MCTARIMGERWMQIRQAENKNITFALYTDKWSHDSRYAVYGRPFTNILHNNVTDTATIERLSQQPWKNP